MDRLTTILGRAFDAPDEGIVDEEPEPSDESEPKATKGKRGAKKATKKAPAAKKGAPKQAKSPVEVESEDDNAPAASNAKDTAGAASHPTSEQAQLASQEKGPGSAAGVDTNASAAHNAGTLQAAEAPTAASTGSGKANGASTAPESGEPGSTPTAVVPVDSSNAGNGSVSVSPAPEASKRPEEVPAADSQRPREASSPPQDSGEARADTAPSAGPEASKTPSAAVSPRNIAPITAVELKTTSVVSGDASETQQGPVPGSDGATTRDKSVAPSFELPVSDGRPARKPTSGDHDAHPTRGSGGVALRPRKAMLTLPGLSVRARKSPRASDEVDSAAPAAPACPPQAAVLFCDAVRYIDGPVFTSTKPGTRSSGIPSLKLSTTSPARKPSGARI